MIDSSPDPKDETSLDEYSDTVYEVTISTREADGIATEDEIRTAIYQGIAIVDSEDAVFVQRA